MNKNKLSDKLLSSVSVLNINDLKVFVVSNDFNKTKLFLKTHQFNFLPYRFANCFYVTANYLQLKLLSNLDEVKIIHTNTLVQTLQHEQDFIKLSNLTNNEFLGQNQTICFIDTGIHPHLDFILPYCKILKFVDFINKKTEPYDDNGHGTFVSGIACSNGIFSPNNKGFAPKANIISLKALDKNGSSNSNVILDAMQWVYENHKVYNITVVCMSFGADILESLDPLSNGAEALWKVGIIVVAAAGNSGPNKKTIKSPGCNPNIITVGALDVNSITPADFSSRGPTIYGHKPDLLAPAVNIISCNNKSTPYTHMSGTSVATPIVAAICANLKSRFTKMTNNDIKKFLISNCTKITGDIDIEGAGYLNFNNIQFTK